MTQKELSNENKQLKEQLETTEQDIQKLESENDLLKVEITLAKKTVTEMQEALIEADEKPKTILPTVKIGKETYEIIVKKAKVEGQLISAEELAKTPKKCEELIEKGSGIFKHIV